MYLGMANIYPDMSNIIRSATRVHQSMRYPNIYKHTLVIWCCSLVVVFAQSGNFTALLGSYGQT